MRFDFATAARIVFGRGSVREVLPAAVAIGKRALVVTGASSERAAPFIRDLTRAGVSCVPFAVAGEPTLEVIRQGTAYARLEGCDLVAAMGGGSVLDSGKAVAALLTNAGDPLDYLEVIGRGQPLERAAAPCIAIPTTAGTGSEVTRNAVLGSPEHRVKASLRSAGMLPRLAVVDPELTHGLPRPLTASTGLDALTQLIEPYVSSRANPMTDQFCIEGLQVAATALPRAWEHSADGEARESMSWAALLGGLALANAGLGAVHGFAAPLGGVFSAPHGALCAAVLPYAMEVNVRALCARAPESTALRRYDEIARLLSGGAQASAKDGPAWVATLCQRLQVPRLRTYGVEEQHVPELVEAARKTNSMKGNPIELNDQELAEIVMRAI
jgi:alcohol dehydrogenase class IV